MMSTVSNLIYVGLYHILPYIALFLTRKTSISEEKVLHDSVFTQFVYFHTHPITLLLQILEGRIHGPSPHLKFWGDLPPVLPKSPPMHRSKIERINYSANNIHPTNQLVIVGYRMNIFSVQSSDNFSNDLLITRPDYKFVAIIIVIVIIIIIIINHHHQIFV